MRVEQEHGFYTVDEDKRFHSFDGEPAIVVMDYIEVDENGVESKVYGYKAWYEHGELIRSERNGE